MGAAVAGDEDAKTEEDAETREEKAGEEETDTDTVLRVREGARRHVERHARGK